MTEKRQNPPAEIGPGDDILVQEKTETKTPAMYKVFLLNDDFTPMDFVIEVLQRFFRLDREDATHVMLSVHNHGVGLCGVFTFDVAETKSAMVNNYSRVHEHPLQCTIEEA